MRQRYHISKEQIAELGEARQKNKDKKVDKAPVDLRLEPPQLP